LSALERALAAEGRDPGTLRRTVGVVVREPSAEPDEEEASVAGSVDELARALTEYEALGIDDVIVVLLSMTGEALERLAAAAARLPSRAGSQAT
jgi:hypothetical protein